MATARIGYFNTGSSPDMGIVSADSQRAYVPDALASTVIFYEMGARIGRNGSTTPSTRMGIGITSTGDAGGSPSSLITYTSAQSPSTLMTSGSQGAVVTANLAAPFIGQAGSAYALVLTSANAILGHGMIQQASLPGKDNYNFYDKSNTSSTPTDPIGGSSHFEGHMSLWATGEVNVAPNTPTALAPTGTLASTDLTPAMSASFSDANETLPNSVAFDKMKQFNIQVRRKSDSVSFWDFTGNANTGEQAARAYNRAYAGTTLVAGVTYQQRVRMSDLAGAWSGWTGWIDFTINAGGTVTVSGATFAGKQNSQSPSPFVATWNHPNPLNADRAIVRVLDSANNVLQTMTQASPVTVSVANGGSISITWAQTGFSALARGGSGYKWQMQARDTATAWSPWSSSVAFSVNATPGIPTNRSPKTGDAPVSFAPKLSASATDADDTLGSLVVTGEILRADGSSVSRTLTWNATTQKYEYQTVIGTNEVQLLTRAGTISGGTFTITFPTNSRGASAATAAINWNDPTATIQTKVDAVTNVGAGRVIVGGGPVSTTNITLSYAMEFQAVDMPQVTIASSLTGGGTLTPSTTTAGVAGDFAGFQTMQWRVQAGDGVSTSAFSSYQTFVYSVGPTVTITAPTDESTVTTSTSRITWTVPSGGPQVKYQVTVTEVDVSDAPVAGVTPYDSGLVVSANLFHDVPTGVYRNGRRYQISVAVTNSTPQTGYSQAQQFFVTYTPPASVTGFVASPFALWSGTDSDAIRMDWNATLVAGDQFVGYDLWRTALGPASLANGFVAAEIDETIGERKYLRRITNPAQLAYIDANPPAGVAFLYEIEQVVRQGVDELRSTAVGSTVSVLLPQVVLTAALDPESFGVELRHKQGTGAYLASTLRTDKQKVVPVGGSKGRTVASPLLEWNDKASFELITDRFRTCSQRIRDVTALAERGGTLCLRDFSGLKRYLTLDGIELRRFGVNRAQVDFNFSEEYFAEGETA